MEKKNINMSFNQFKHKFKMALKQQEKENTTEDLLNFIMDPNENYLYTLYNQVYKNNPDKNFIFQNPLLVLNYIFIDINNKESNPIIGRHNKIIKSVISNVKEEDAEYSHDSKKRNQEKDMIESASNESEKKIKENIKIIHENKRKSALQKDIQKNEEPKEQENILKINLKVKEKEKNIGKNKDEINSNIKDESSLKTMETKNKNETQNFSIVSGEAVFIFIPEKKVSNFKAKAARWKSMKNLFQKKLAVPNNFKFNLIEEFESKQNSSFLKIKQKETTFVQKMERYSNFSLINNEENEDFKKTSAFIQMKNKNFSSIIKSHNNSLDTSNVLGKPLKEDKNKNNFKKKANNSLFGSFKFKSLWENKDKNDNNRDFNNNINKQKNIYKKINNNKIIKEKRKEIKQPKKNILSNKIKKEVDDLMKKEEEKTYLRHAKIKQLQSQIKEKEKDKDKDKEKDKALTFREEKGKHLENEAMKLIKSGFFNQKKYNGFNMYMNNIRKMDIKEEKKESNRNKSSMNYSYANLNYKKVKAKKQNERKEEIGEKRCKNKLNSYEKEKEKILKFNNKITNKKINEELKMIDTTNEDDYYIINCNSKINYKKNKFDESNNNKNYIFDPSNSYINYINSNSNNNKFKKLNNRNNEISSERSNNHNNPENSLRLIQKYKLIITFLKEKWFIKDKGKLFVEFSF